MGISFLNITSPLQTFHFLNHHLIDDNILLIVYLLLYIRMGFIISFYIRTSRVLLVLSFVLCPFLGSLSCLEHDSISKSVCSYLLLLLSHPPPLPFLFTAITPSQCPFISSYLSTPLFLSPLSSQLPSPSLSPRPSPHSCTVAITDQIYRCWTATTTFNDLPSPHWENLVTTGGGGVITSLTLYVRVTVTDMRVPMEGW